MNYADFCKGWSGHLALAYSVAAKRRYAARPTGPHPDPAAYDADVMKWKGTVWHGGGTKDGYVFVQVFA